MPNLELGDDYVLLPKLLWDVMVDWYGGGPVFCRQVVRVVPPSLQLPERARGGDEDSDVTEHTGRYVEGRARYFGTLSMVWDLAMDIKRRGLRLRSLYVLVLGRFCLPCV